MKLPCDINSIFHSVPLFDPVKSRPRVTAGLSWGALGSLDGTGRFRLPQISGYNGLVMDGPAEYIVL